MQRGRGWHCRQILGGFRCNLCNSRAAPANATNSMSHAPFPSVNGIPQSSLKSYIEYSFKTSKIPRVKGDSLAIAKSQSHWQDELLMIRKVRGCKEGVWGLEIYCVQWLAYWASALWGGDDDLWRALRTFVPTNKLLQLFWRSFRRIPAVSNEERWWCRGLNLTPLKWKYNSRRMKRRWKFNEQNSK